MKRLFITGEQFDTEYANKIGLIDHIASDEKLDVEINKYIEIINSSGPKAIIEVKNLLDKFQKMDILEYMDHTVKKISELRISEEGQEGINAFLEKRKTKWRH